MKHPQITLFILLFFYSLRTFSAQKIEKTPSPSTLTKFSEVGAKKTEEKLPKSENPLKFLDSMRELFEKCKALAHRKEEEIRATVLCSEITEPIDFIHIGQTHAVENMSSNRKGLTLAVIQSQVTVYTMLKKLLEEEPDTLIFHEQFHYNWETGKNFQEMAMEEEPIESDESLAFEKIYLEQFQDISEVVCYESFTTQRKALDSSFLGHWLFWTTDLLEIDTREPHKCGALFFFQNKKYRKLKAKFRGTHASDKVYSLTKYLINQTHNKVFSLLYKTPNKSIFEKILLTLQEPHWPESIQTLAKKFPLNFSETETQKYNSSILHFEREIFFLIKEEFVCKMREQEAIREINLSVLKERPKRIVLVYGFDHDFEKSTKDPKSGFKFPYIYQYSSTSKIEETIFKEEISRFPLDHNLSPREDFLQRRLELIEPGFLTSRESLKKIDLCHVEEVD